MSSAFLEGTHVLLEREGLSVPGVASNSAEALWAAEEFRPDVFLVDITLGEESVRWIEPRRGRAS